MVRSSLLFTSLFILSLTSSQATIPLHPLHNSSLFEGNKTDPCYIFLQNLTNSKIPVANRSIEVNNSLSYSGHNINDLGNYRKCSNKSSQAYSLITLSATGSQGMMGFCAPSYCSTEQLQYYSDSIIQFITNMTGKDASQYVQTAFIDPTNTGIHGGFWLYFSIILFFALGALVIAGTISANTKRTVKRIKQQPDSVLREALLLNKESTNETFSKYTVDTFLASATAPSLQSPSTAILESAKEPESPKSLLVQIAECFDLKQNFADLVKNELEPGHDPNLNVVHGIRALSYGWVVYGHTFLQCMRPKNMMYMTTYFKSAWFLVLMAALYAVDTFFFLSGFFTGFFMLSKLRTMKIGFKSFGQLVLHRWLRLWPAYFVAILFSWKLSVYMGDGVLWYSYVSGAQACDWDAWKNWLFMDNALTVSNNCFSWGWYLSNDFQMFLLAPFICWIYFKNRQRSLHIIWALFLMSMMAAYNYSSNSGVYYMLEIFTKGGGDVTDYMANYYGNPIVRMAPYLLGLYLGFLFKEFKQGKKNFFSWIKESNFKSAVCAIVGFEILLFITFFPRGLQMGDQWSSGFSMTWGISGRTLFALGVFLIIAPGLVGNLKTLGAFLSNYYFTLISRISYCGYLVHLIILQIVSANTDQVPGFNQGNESMIGFAIAVISCFAAIVLHLLIEKPVINIETRILNKKKDGSNAQKKPIVKSEVKND